MESDKYFIQAMKSLPNENVKVIEIGDNRYKELCHEQFPFAEYAQTTWDSYKEEIWKYQVIILTNFPPLSWEALGYTIDHMLDYIIMPEVHFVDRSFNNGEMFYWGKAELTEFIKLRAHLVKLIEWEDKNIATLLIRSWKSYEY